MSLLQAILFGLLQGITELFPVSSLGHSVILPKLLGWNYNEHDPLFLTFLVATHTATALVLFGFFWKDWMKILSGMVRSLKNREIGEHDADAKLGWLLVVATVPAGVLGLLFEERLKALFASPQVVAAVLILNGLMLFGAELVSRRKKGNNSPEGSDARIAQLTWFQAIKVGVMQCLALVPGISRTGSTITGGLLVGLSREDAARFSFLLATPIIGAASILKLPELANQSSSAMVLPTAVGSIAAAVGAFISVKFLTKYFETNTLWPFALYCVVFGAGVSILFLVR